MNAKSSSTPSAEEPDLSAFLYLKDEASASGIAQDGALGALSSLALLAGEFSVDAGAPR